MSNKTNWKDSEGRKWKVLSFDELNLATPATYSVDGELLTIERDEWNNWLAATYKGKRVELPQEMLHLGKVLALCQA